MGWLFGKKKMMPKVPFPLSRSSEEGQFQFSRTFPSEKVIEPENFKQAAGLDQPIFPEVEEEPSPLSQRIKEELNPFTPEQSTPVYVKVDVYESILGELDGLRGMVSQLNNANVHLRSSEYNEETNFTKLRKAIRNIHDRLLQMDKILFKA